MIQGLRAFLGNRLKPSWPLLVRYPDGKRRLGTVRIFSLTRLWLADIPELAEESAAVRASYRGGDVIDVGAFHGWYSVLLAGDVRRSTTFVSIEPDERAQPILEQNLKTIDRAFPNVRTVLVKDGAGNGRALATTWPGGPMGHPRVMVDQTREGSGGVTVDGLVRENGLSPGLVKIDVEGAELFVLEGMAETLATHRPVVWLELHPAWLPADVGAADVEALLCRPGYRKTVVVSQDGIERQVWIHAGG